MDEQTTQVNEPVQPDEEVNEQDVQEPETQAEDVETTDVAEEAPEQEQEQVEEQVVEEEEEEDFPTFQQPQVPQLDFNNLPVDADGNVQVDALAQSINQALAQSAESAREAARAEYEERRAEERAWDKAQSKYPELKNNKDLRDMVQAARMGQVVDTLNRDPNAQVKIPTPSQIADRLFKQIGAAKTEGMRQATESVKVQKSATLETGSSRSDTNVDKATALRQKIASPNRGEAEEAQRELLKMALFGD